MAVEEMHELPPISELTLQCSEEVSEPERTQQTSETPYFSLQFIESPKVAVSAQSEQAKSVSHFYEKVQGGVKPVS